MVNVLPLARVTMNTVFASTLPPPTPFSVTDPPSATLDPPLIVPYDDATVTLLVKHATELWLQENLPSWKLDVAEQSPPLSEKVIHFGRHWQLPDVMALALLLLFTSAYAPWSATHALYSVEHDALVDVL